MEHIIFGIFLFITSLFFSKLEINAEGPSGWAEKFPTWRINNRWTQLTMGAKPLTGYHLYFFLFMITIVQIPYFLGFIEFSVKTELRIISYLVLFFVLEDFLWFVLNPSFGLKKFRPEYIWWHSSNWWWIMPRDYWLFIPLGLFFYVISWLI